MAGRAEDEGLSSLADREPLQVLRGQAVQPAQPVLAGDPQHASVGPVDECRGLFGRPLLAHRVAVVRGDALVRPAGLHCPRQSY